MLGVSVVMLAAGLLMPTPAAAEPMELGESSGSHQEGLWYWDWLGMGDVSEAGFTGDGITVAVVDGGINTDLAVFEDASITVTDVCDDPDTGETVRTETDDPTMAEHGSLVVSLLVGNGKGEDGGVGTKGIIPDADILFYGIGETGSSCRVRLPVVDEYALGPFSGLAAAVTQAVIDGADVVSLSRIDENFYLAPVEGGSQNEWVDPLALAASAEVPIVSGAPNPHANFGVRYPTGLNGVVAVGASDREGDVGSATQDGVEEEGQGSANLAFMAPGQDLVVPGNVDGEWQERLRRGTSAATPLVAGTVALGLEAWPEASAYQVLEAMRDSAIGAERDEDGDPVWFGPQNGYGYADPLGLIETDPTDYSGQNPFFVSDVDDPRCGEADTFEDCAWASTPSPDELKALSGDQAQDPTSDKDESENSSTPEPDSGEESSPNSAEALDNDSGGISATGWVVLGGAISLAVVLAAVLVVVLRRRS